MNLESILTIAQKEMRDALRNRWFVLYALAFAGLSLALAWFALTGSGGLGVSGFGRTTASLINLVLLIVPLMGLTLGALSLAGERERGTLVYLMAQPIGSTELLLGKFLGLALALVTALLLGFGLTGILMLFLEGNGDFRLLLAVLGLSVLLAVASLSIGFFISSATRRTAAAVGLALFVWLALVYFGDLGLMGSSFVLDLSISQLFGLALVNPLQVFKIAAVLDLRENLEVLGPAGVYAYRTYGSALMPMLVGLLLAWIMAPLVAAAFAFKKRGVL